MKSRLVGVEGTHAAQTAMMPAKSAGVSVGRESWRNGGSVPVPSAAKQMAVRLFGKVPTTAGGDGKGLSGHFPIQPSSFWLTD